MLAVTACSQRQVVALAPAAPPEAGAALVMLREARSPAGRRPGSRTESCRSDGLGWHRPAGSLLDSRGGVGDLGFEVGDAAVLEAQVGAGGLESFVENAVVGGELADTLLQGGVLGGDPLDGFLGPFGFQVADLAEEFADAGALGEDLGVGG